MKHLAWLLSTMLAGCVSAPNFPQSGSPPQATARAPGAQDAALARDAALDAAAAGIADAGATSQHSIDSPSGPVTVSVVTMPDSVFFDFGRAEPRSDAAPALNALARAVQSSPPDSVLTVAGNTDATGPERVNQLLSNARARAVVAALVGRGVAPGRLVAIGFGATRPIAPDDNEAGRALNRRVELALSPSFAANAAVLTTIVPVAAHQASGRQRPALGRTPAPLNVHLNQPDPVSRNSLGPPVSY